ncbi:hypothetical protein YC2023_050437 [Brassica napus]
MSAYVAQQEGDKHFLIYIYNSGQRQERRLGFEELTWEITSFSSISTRKRTYLKYSNVDHAILTNGASRWRDGSRPSKKTSRIPCSFGQ